MHIVACVKAVPSSTEVKMDPVTHTIVRDGRVYDHGLIVEESRNRDRASFVISAPGVRERKPEFIPL